jgi:hypothetical protein
MDIFIETSTKMDAVGLLKNNYKINLSKGQEISKSNCSHNFTKEV